MHKDLAQTLDWAYSWIKQEKKQYLDGQWVKETNYQNFDLINPSNQQVLCSLPLASKETCQMAAKAADQCHQQGIWSKQNGAQKAQVLRQIANLIRQHQTELAVLETLPNGKLFSEAFEGDIPTCADIFDYYAGWTDKHYGESMPVDADYINFTRKEPVGPCALIAPWNFPLYQAALKIAPALAMGNSLVLKPSEYTPLSAIYLIELIDKNLDLPQGLINLIVTDAKAAEQLTLDHLIKKVSFTGSTLAGRKIVQNSGASNLKSATLELGGKSPCIFFADTPNLDKALDRAFEVMFSHKGEKCSEPTRFLIEQSIYDYALERLIKKAEQVRCGDPFDPISEQGPQCNRQQYEKIMAYIEIGKKEADLVAGGKADTQGKNAEGYFIRPTIFSNVPVNARIAHEEIFGPVLSCTAFDSEEQALEIANSTPYGLAAGLYTSDIQRAHRLAERLDAGMVFINRYGCYSLSSPFGGFRQSGWGKEMALHSLAAYTKTKSIWVYHGDD